MRGPPFSLAASRYAVAMRYPLIALALLSLAACGKADNDPGPGAVTMGEARALDEAADMIEAQKLPPEVVQPQTGTAQPAPSAKPTG